MLHHILVFMKLRLICWKKFAFLLIFFQSFFCISQTTYYSKSIGYLNLVSTWGTNPNGSGTAPTNFTSANCIYVVVNNFAPLISANWAISGTGSTVHIGDGSQIISFAIPSPFSVYATFSVTANSKLTINNGGSIVGTINVDGNLSILSTANPTLGTLSSSSTVVYGAGANQTVLNASYANLILSGSGTKSLANSTNTSVSDSLTINSGIVFALSTYSGLTTSMNGTILGTGTVKGTNTSNLSIGGTGNFGKLIFAGGGKTVLDFNVNKTALGTVQLGSQLTVAGVFSHSAGILDLNGNKIILSSTISFPTSATIGSMSGSPSSILIVKGSGTITNALLMNQSSANTKTLKQLTMNRSGKTLSIGDTLRITGTVYPKAGTIASSGFLTLIASSPSVTANISTIGSSASVTGNVIVQSDEKGGTTGWTLMGGAGISGLTFANWNTSFAITCATCPDGSTIGGNPFTSIYSYSEPTGGLYSNAARYIPIMNITDPITAGIGYWVYLGTSTSTTNDIITSVSGPIEYGNFVYNITMTNSGGGTNATDHGYNLISNPYPSPISWSSLSAGNTNVNNAIYIYNPDLGGYASYVNGVSSPAVGSGGIGNSIPAGQGFYVKANAATTLTAMESNKTNSSQVLLRQQNTQQSVSSNPMVFRINAAGIGLQNETAVYFDPNATAAFDFDYDAMYMTPDAGKLGIATSLTGTDYAINGLPSLTTNVSIPLKVNAPANGSFIISASDLQNLPGGACVSLHDNYTNLDQNLKTGNYSCNIMDTELVARFVINIQINNILTVSGTPLNPTCNFSGNGAVMATAAGSSGPWNYYWKDTGNNILRTTFSRMGPDTLPNLNAGNYSVDVQTAGNCDNGSGNFSLQPNLSVSSSFSSSATTIISTNDSAYFSFTNTSLNANTFWWDFGDGMGNADTNTAHTYHSSGDYTVTLYAIKSPCNDTSTSEWVVTVIDTVFTMSTPNINDQNNLFISRDENGYYAKFNYEEPRSAVLAVQDILGQLVSPELSVSNITKDKIYFSMSGCNTGIYLLSVLGGDGQKIRCKVLKD